ncbi:unnamed protein product, partial [Owenia fusiformis]
SVCLPSDIPGVNCCTCKETGEDGILDPITDECYCKCMCKVGEEFYMSYKRQGGQCICERCPDKRIKTLRADGSLWCPCKCADGQDYDKMRPDGSCDCSCLCKDRITKDIIDQNSQCPCKCECKDCSLSSLGSDGKCACQDKCPCGDNKHGIWRNCKCYLQKPGCVIQGACPAPNCKVCRVECCKDEDCNKERPGYPCMVCNNYICENCTACKPLPDIKDGTITYSNDSLAQGTLAYYVCNPPTELNNHKLTPRLCTDKFTWTGTAPVCMVFTHPGNCSALASIEGGSITYSNDKKIPGTFAYYVCHEGYEIKEASTATRTCTENLTWDGTEPSCVKSNPYQCDLLPDIKGGSISYSDKRRPPGTLAFYNCSYLYELDDPNLSPRKCLNDSTWEEPAPSCIIYYPPGVDCPANSSDPKIGDVHRLFPDTTSCHRFYHCGLDGIPWLKWCPSGLLWNNDRLYCDWPKNVECPTEGDGLE